jgi:peptidoglycan/LPS O-acetylase OafA/YrhL
VLALPNLTLVGQEWLLFAAVEPGQGTLYLTANFHAEPLPAWHFQWIPQAWTVGLELAFYAVAPLLVRRGPGVLAGVVLASLGLRYWLMRGLGLAHDPWTYRFFPTELALFLGGALCWHGYRALRQRGWLRPAVVWGGTVLALALVLGYRLLPDPLHRAPLGLPLLLLALPLWIVCPFHATRQWRFDRALGELSYPVYLVHYLLVFVVDALAQPTLDAHRGSLVLVGSLALAWLGERCIGRRWNAARQRVRAALPGAGATPWSPATNPPQ